MADVFASSAHAPAVIVQALAVDQASVARPVLEYSPLLIDADLVDIVATGNSEVQCGHRAAHQASRIGSAQRSPKSVPPPLRSS